MFNWLKSKVASSAAVLPTPAATTSLDRAHELRLEGNAWLDKGNIAAAAASYQQAVAHDPRSVDARISLGFALSELARFDEAEPHGAICF